MKRVSFKKNLVKTSWTFKLHVAIVASLIHSSKRKVILILTVMSSSHVMSCHVMSCHVTLQLDTSGTWLLHGAGLPLAGDPLHWRGPVSSLLRRPVQPPRGALQDGPLSRIRIVQYAVSINNKRKWTDETLDRRHLLLAM